MVVGDDTVTVVKDATSGLGKESLSWATVFRPEIWASAPSWTWSCQNSKCKLSCQWRQYLEEDPPDSSALFRTTPSQAVVTAWSSRQLSPQMLRDRNDKSDKKFAQSFSKLASILQDFCLFCAEKNESNQKQSPSQERFLSPNFKLWLPEIWELFTNSIVFITSSREEILPDDQYYLVSCKQSLGLMSMVEMLITWVVEIDKR